MLPVGPPPKAFPNQDLVPVPARSAETLVLHALRGPRDDWLSDMDALAVTTWTVSDHSDRVGIRLSGEPLRTRGLPAGAGAVQRGSGLAARFRFRRAGSLSFFWQIIR